MYSWYESLRMQSGVIRKKVHDGVCQKPAQDERKKKALGASGSHLICMLPSLAETETAISSQCFEMSQCHWSEISAYGTDNSSVELID
jgi:hypothetical protein